MVDDTGMLDLSPTIRQSVAGVPLLACYISFVVGQLDMLYGEGKARPTRLGGFKITIG